MAKDLALYREAAAGEGGPQAVGALAAEAWQRFAQEEPGADFPASTRGGAEVPPDTGGNHVLQ